MDPSHALNSLLGLGLHKCPAKLFLEQVGDKISFGTPKLKFHFLVDNARGLHPWFTVATMALTYQQIFRVIFKQKDLKRANGRKGQLNSTSLRPNAAPVRFLILDWTYLMYYPKWDSEIYLTEDGSFNYYPRQMVIEVR